MAPTLLLWSREGVCGQVDAAVFSSSWWSFLYHPAPLLLTPAIGQGEERTEFGGPDLKDNT